MFTDAFLRHSVTNSTVATDTSPPCKGICIPESSKFLLVESVIRENFACGIQNLGFEFRIQLEESGILLTTGIQNPRSIDKDWNPKSKIGLDSLTWRETL